MAHNIIAEKKHLVQSDAAAAEELFTGKSQSKSQSKPKFRTVILDESHYIKSEKTKRAIAARSKKMFIEILILKNVNSKIDTIRSTLSI